MDDVRHDGEWFETLSAYADGECGPEERKRVDAHIRRCQECREWLEQVVADRKLFTDALVSSAQGIDLADRVMEEVEKMPAPEKPQSPVPGTIVPQAGRGGTAVLRITLVEVLMVVVTCSILAAILFPTFARAREKARVASCLSNIKQIALAAQMFAQDNEGKLPDAQRWMEQLEPYTKNEQIYKCPEDQSSAKTSYAMNPRYSGAKIADYADADKRIIFYDADASGQPIARHNGGTNCAFMDGHAKWMKGVPDLVSVTTDAALPTEGYGLADKLKMAYTASAELWVDQIQVAIIAAEQVVVQRGGFVLLSEMQASMEPYNAQLTCRVPTSKVIDTVNDLGKLGWIAHRVVRGEDLTRRFLDKTREVTDQQTRQERLTEAVSEAVKEKHVVQLESNLAGAETAESTAHSDLYDVADRTTLATITATLIQQEGEEGKPVARPLSASTHAAWGALKGVGIAIARACIWLLAFVWIWLPLGWLGVKLVRHYRRAG